MERPLRRRGAVYRRLDRSIGCAIRQAGFCGSKIAMSLISSKRRLVAGGGIGTREDALGPLYLQGERLSDRAGVDASFV